MESYFAVLQKGRNRLKSCGIKDADTDAWLLFEAVTGFSRSGYFLRRDDRMPKEDMEAYLGQIEKRAMHIPVQQLLGSAWFYGRVFHVNEHVLIPRQDTEQLVESALKRMKKDGSILDLCTGSGCILLTLLSEQGRDGTGDAGVDISGEALQVAMKNGSLYAPNVSWIRGDLFEALDDRRFDLITANPPYIPTGTIETLSEEVRLHEPVLALDGAEDGLIFYKRITKAAGGFLNPEGLLYFEIGYDQGAAVTSLMKEAGFCDVQLEKDLSGMDRVVHGRWMA